MKNVPSFYRMKFECQNGISYGFIAYDDEESTFDNSFEDAMESNDGFFMADIIENGNPVALNLIGLGYTNGAFIDGTFYEPKEFAKIAKTENFYYAA